MTTSLPEFTESFLGGPSAYDLELDGTKIAFYRDRVEAWQRGEKIAPITMDVAWTRSCNAACDFCYAQLQASDGHVITQKNAYDFLEDAAEIGVKGVSLISDGESTTVSWFDDSVVYGSKLGLKIGTSTNGVRLNKKVLEKILPHLSYLRINFSGGEQKRWAEIMGLQQKFFPKVIQNVKDAMEIKRRDNLPISVNLQMVVMPKHGDQIVPFAKLAKEIRPSYAILKHTANNIDHDLDVDYREYSPLFPAFKEAEAYSDKDFRVVVKWSRLADEGRRDYKKCFGPPFLLQMSGNGLISTCGFHFQEKYKKFHIGSICTERFRDMYKSDRYWEVVRYLASDEFDAQRNCGENCLQTNTNSWLDKYVKGQVSFNDGPMPAHSEFL